MRKLSILTSVLLLLSAGSSFAIPEKATEYPGATYRSEVDRMHATRRSSFSRLRPGALRRPATNPATDFSQPITLSISPLLNPLSTASEPGAETHQ
jgi:hypothetical protein